MASDTSRRVAGATALAVAMATGHEGIKFTPYYDPPGILTVCRGHTGNVQMRRYTLAECDALMTVDMKNAVQIVERCVPGLPEKVLAAFADAVYNMGATIVCNLAKSTAARLLKAGDLVNACMQLPRWDKATVLGILTALPGLTKRRAEEKELCLEGSS
jgi:lysozyme